MSPRMIDTSERRARLARRHRLAPDSQSPDPVEIARSIVAYHATDPASVYLAMAMRSGFAPASTLDKALYDDRALVRMLGMRRTMFVVPMELVGVVHGACTQSIAATERRRTLKMIADGGIAEPEPWLERAEADTVRALRKRGEATTRELSDDVPELRAEIVLSPGKKYEARATLAPRVLFQLGAEGRAIRGRPVKSWVSNYRWVLTDTWLPAGVGEVSPEAAERELARAWLRAFGPGTVTDLKWWTGWNLGRTRKVLEAVGAVEVGLEDGEVGYVLADDVDPLSPVDPWVTLLPSLDPAVMGWAMTGRHWYLGESCRAAVYDRNGNIGPTVWWGGRIVGGWAQRRDSTISYRLLEDIGAEGASAVEAVVGRLQEWLGDVRVTPRFRTPLEKELAAK